ncbi:MAG: DUF4266 domain-containing protein [Sandaracinaceae bacterium]
MRRVLLLALVSFALSLSACVIVPRYARGTLADPAMDSSATALEDSSMTKMHGAREVAAGGNGRPAGGGCACGN